MKKGIRDHFCKVSSDFKPFWQVTIFHTRLPHKPNHGLGLRTRGEILKTYKNEFDWLKTIFFMKKGIRDHFCKVSSDLKPFWQVTIFHTRLPHKPNHGLGLRQGWNSENLKKWVWMAQNDIFHEKRHTRSFLQSFKWFKAILTSYHISPQDFPHKPNHGLGLKQGFKFWKLTKMILTGSKRFFSWKKAYAIIFCKVSSDLKPFWQVTIFHTRLPHKPNHGLGLRTRLKFLKT